MKGSGLWESMVFTLYVVKRSCSLFLLLLMVLSLLLVCLSPTLAARSSFQLSSAERSWLDENLQEIFLYYNVEFPPIEFISPQGEFIGMGADVIHRIEELLEVSFIKIPSDNWAEHLRALESGSCAIAPTIVRTPQREEFAFFTTPYAKAPVVLITTNRISGSLALDDAAGLKLGVVSGYATETYLKDQAPIHSFEIATFTNVPEGLMAVSVGEIDVFAENIAVAAYYIQERGIPNLRVAGETEYLFSWSIGVSREYPLLYSSIQKALDAIGPEELLEIQKYWITLETPSAMSEETLQLLKLGGVFVFLLFAMLALLSYILKKRLNERVEDLKESQSQYRRLVENSPAIVCQLKMDAGGFLSFLYLSESLQEIAGIDPKEIISDSNALFDRIHPEDRMGLEEAIVVSSTTQKPLRKMFRLKTKGRTIWMEIALSPESMMDSSSLWDGFIQDITERKERLEEIEASNDRLQTVMNSIDSFIYIADMETFELLFVNEYGRKTWNSDLIGLPCYRALQGYDEPCSFCTNNKLTDEEGRPKGVFQWEFQNKVNGRWYALIDRAIQWVDGRIVRMEIATDITEVKRAQEVVAEKNKELEQIVYVASHDLRTPLVNVEGYSKELEYTIEDFKKAIIELAISQEDLEANVSPLFLDMEEAIFHIRNSAQQMDALLKGLLKLSRIGRAAHTILPLNMDELVASVVSSMEYQVKELGAEIHVDGLPPCLGDRVQVSQVFTNLLSNALKFLHPNRRGAIAITGAQEKTSSIYCVADNGIGIDGKHLEVIFELFHQLDPLAKEGDGLGLTIVRQILSRLNGKIWVESELGQGSRFYVLLPYAPFEEE